jgi:LCP family protein required for cell wall assembly
MNFLLIGLDSRKDQNGDDLPWSLLKHLHAGDSDDGGYNTNTLILAHVGSDDRVSAFSIPRDDWVSFNGVPGYNHIKIKEAYGLTKQYVEQKMIDKGVSDQKELETKGREAARAATLKAVRKLTGVPIDYFAEVNLAGFYDLAKSLGGVDVCLKHAVYDDYSGADFPAGPQTLDAEQALAFVRQRHGLENGDLDRTHRQQAFLSSVMHQLQDAGTFTNLGKLKGLMAVARKDVVLSSGWDEDHVPQDGRAGRWFHRIPDAARGALRQHQRSRRQHRRPRGDQGRSVRRLRDFAGVHVHDHRGRTQPVDGRRRGERQQRRRSGHQGRAHAEARRLHHGRDTRPGSR